MPFVKILLERVNSKSMNMDLIRPSQALPDILIGECMAEFALFDGIEQAWTVKATDSCELLCLYRTDF